MTVSQIRILAIVLLAASATLLTGCIKPYKIDVQQGTALTLEQIDQVKPGMSRREVRYILGTPPITDSFHNERWDYVYSFRAGKNADVEKRRFIVLFENDVVASIEGNRAELENDGQQSYMMEGRVVDNSHVKKESRLKKLLGKTKDKAVKSN